MDAKKENEEKKKYLWGYQRAKRHLIRLEEELEEVRLGKLCPSVIQDGMPKASGGSDLSAYMSQVDDLERRLVKFGIELNGWRMNQRKMCWYTVICGE